MAGPVIAITGPRRGAVGPRTLAALAIRLYGGRPLQLRPGDEQRRHEYQGVVVTGGHDIEPVLYAAEPEVEPNYDTARDALETAVIRAWTSWRPWIGTSSRRSSRPSCVSRERS